MELSTKQKIVFATIECIEKEGINAITTRSIAREADVNSAAINYYFGSKERLIDEVFDYLQKDFLMDFTELIGKDADLKTTVEELVLYMMEGTIKYPNIVRAVLYEPFINNNNNCVYVDKLNELCRELYKKIDREYGVHDARLQRVNIVQLISSCLLMGVFPWFFKDFLEMDLKDEEALKNYARNLADVFVNAIK